MRECPKLSWFFSERFSWMKDAQTVLKCGCLAALLVLLCHVHIDMKEITNSHQKLSH